MKKMKVLKIKKFNVSEKGENNFKYSHHFGVRVKSGFLSHKDANVFVDTNRKEIFVDEVVNAIESQEESVIREILDNVCSKNDFASLMFGNISFTTNIGSDDCKFSFLKYDSTSSIIDNPENW